MIRIGGDYVKGPVRETYVVAGRIQGGSGVAKLLSGKGFALAYQSTGLYRITPDVNYGYLASAVATVISNTHPAYTITVKDYVGTPASATVGAVQSAGQLGYVDFLVASAGSATDLTNVEEFGFVLVMARTAVP